MKNLIIALLMLTCIAKVGWTQNTRKLESLIVKTRKKFNIPAVSVTLIKNDTLVHVINGVKVITNNIPVTPDNLFHIGSCSKSVLATLVAKLIESGQISWTTRFFDVVEELKPASNPMYLQITLEDLFLCRAGIKPYVSGEEKFPDIDPGAENPRYEFTKYLLSLPPASDQISNGKFQFLYSNAGYTMIALMIERITNLSYEEFVSAEMKNEFGIEVYFGFPNKIHKDQPWGHMIQGKKIQEFPPDHEYQLHDLLVPAGDLSMKPADFARYIHFHLTGLNGIDNYLKALSYEDLHYKYSGFSLGIANGKMSGRDFSGVDGSAGTFFCRAILFPRSNFAFTIMMNAGSGKGQMKAIDFLSGKIIKKHYGWWWKFWM